MRPIAQLFQHPGKKLVPFITAGYPKLESTAEMVLAAVEGGADMVEIGMPFSDPLADGPVIQEASGRAIQNGITVDGILQSVREIRGETDTPLALMGYINPLIRYGFDRFITHAGESGVNGVILPDLPPEEGEEYYQRIKAGGLSPVLLVAPNTGSARMQRLGDLAEDLLYAVSILGITGSSHGRNRKLSEYLGKLRENTPVPFVVGFGISSPEDVRQVAPHADGVVVGSALLRTIREASAPDQAVRQFIGELKSALGDIEEQLGDTRRRAK